MPAGKLVTWNGNPSTLIPELVIGQVSRSLIGKVRGASIDTPGRDGFWYFPDARGSRRISVQCSILADTTAGRGDVMEDVANWLDVETKAKLIISDRPGVYYEGVVAEAPEPEEWRELGTFDLVWEVDPYSLDINTTTESWTADSDDTRLWSSGLTLYAYPVITVTPTNGTLTEFTLTINNSVMNVLGLIGDDQSVTINSISAVVTTGPNIDTEVTGVYNPALQFMSGVSGSFPVLIPGGNTTRFQKFGGTATSIDIVVVYRKRYRK